MIDKVQKIREEVERLKRWNDNVRESTRHMTLQEEDFNRGKHSSYLEILNFIDSLQEEPVSEDLGEYINELSKQFPDVSFAKLSRIAVRVAKWQKEQIKKAMDLGEPPYLISVEQAYYRTSKLLEE